MLIWLEKLLSIQNVFRLNQKAGDLLLAGLSVKDIVSEIKAQRKQKEG